MNNAILIAVCDDEEIFVENLYTLVTAGANESKIEVVVDKYQDVELLMEQIISGAKPYDLLFLDIDMPKMSGLDAAVKLKENGYDGIFCFVTSLTQHALEAYGLEAIGYLVKPAQYVDVKRKLEKAMIQIRYMRNVKEAEKRYIHITYSNEKIIVDTENVLYVEKRRNQCVIHLEDRELICYEPLKQIYERLNREKFCYAHQGYVVNFDKIKDVHSNFIALGAGREIPVSRKYQPGLRERHLKKIYEGFGLEYKKEYRD